MQVLSKVKELVLQVAASKTISVNLSVGHFVLYPNKTYEFKTTGTLNLTTTSKCMPSAADFVTALDSVKNKGKDPQNPFSNKKDNKLQSLIKRDDDQPAYQHLSNFLKEQIAT